MGVKLRQKLNKGKIHFYLDIHSGGRTREFIGNYLYVNPKNQEEKTHNSENKIIAENKRSEREMAILRNSAIGKWSNGSITAHLEAFRDKYTKKDKGKVTGLLEKWKLHTAKSPTRMFSDLNNNRVKHFVDFLKESVSGETAASYYNKFKQFLEQANADKFCEYNIGSFRPRFRKDKSRLKKDYLLAAELQVLHNTPNDHTEAGHAFIFGCLSGIRPNDIRTLYGRDIRNGRFIRRQSKTENMLEVPLSSTALDIYKKYYRGENKLLFPNIPKTSEGWNKFLERWVKASTINKHITTYCARHSFCMMLLEQKTSWRSIIDHMGWSEDNGMKMLFTYTRALEKHMAEATDGLPRLRV